MKRGQPKIDYYSYCRGEQFRPEPKAKPIDIEPFDDLMLFIVYDRHAKEWQVGEALTGMLVGWAKTRDDAIDEAGTRMMLRDREMGDLILGVIERNGMSPWFCAYFGVDEKGKRL